MNKEKDNYRKAECCMFCIHKAMNRRLYQHCFCLEGEEQVEVSFWDKCDKFKPEKNRITRKYIERTPIKGIK